MTEEQKFIIADRLWKLGFGEGISNISKREKEISDFIQRFRDNQFWNDWLSFVENSEIQNKVFYLRTKISTGASAPKVDINKN